MIFWPNCRECLRKFWFKSLHWFSSCRVHKNGHRCLTLTFEAVADHLEQSAGCTASTRAVTECHHTCTEDAPVLVSGPTTWNSLSPALRAPELSQNTSYLHWRHTCSRQWTDHLEQSVTCTASTRAVTECHHTCTEDTPVLDRPATSRRFYAIPAPNTNALSDLLT